MNREVLRASGVKVHYPIKGGALFDRTVAHVKAVDGVDLVIRDGETYGLVGESGCGKSTLGRALLRLEELTEGTVQINGVDVGALGGRELRAARRGFQMVFQDPLASLDPRLPVKEILFEGLRAHGVHPRLSAALPRLTALIQSVGLPADALERYPHEFSGGQRQRIGIARALSLDPDLIVADEPVSALDVSVQAQVINLLQDLQSELGISLLVIAHDLAVVRHISDRVGVMYLGALVEEAAVADLFQEPMHPYTKVLLSAVPVPSPRIEESRERVVLQGDLPSPAAPPAGCRFHTRCPWRQETRCSTEQPVLREVSTRESGTPRKVACHWAEEIMAGHIAADLSARTILRTVP